MRPGGVGSEVADDTRWGDCGWGRGSRASSDRCARVPSSSRLPGSQLVGGACKDAAGKGGAGSVPCGRVCSALVEEVT